MGQLAQEKYFDLREISDCSINNCTAFVDDTVEDNENFRIAVAFLYMLLYDMWSTGQ